MENGIKNFMKQQSKYWWTSLLVGIISIVVGFWCFSQPAGALAAISILFVAGFMVTGILDIIYALSNKDSYQGWGWTLMGGILDIIISVLLLSMPIGEIATVIVYFIGFWLLFRSIWTISITIELKNHINVTLLVIFAILSLILALWILFSPIIGIAFIVGLTSAAFVVYGIFRIIYAIELKKINKHLKNNE